MAAIDTPQVLNVLRAAAEFTKRMSFKAEADALEAFATRFEREKPTLKVLRGPVQDAKDKASRAMREKLFYDENREVKASMSKQYDEYVGIWKEFADLIHPPSYERVIVKDLVPGV